MPPRFPLAAALPVLAFCLGLIPAMPAQAALSPPGVNIRWDQCYDDGGAANKVFACDTNTGSEHLVASFVLDREMTGVTGVAFLIELASASASWPAWWEFRNSGTCRQSSLTLALTPPPGSANCSDWVSGSASGGLSSFVIGSLGPNTARLGGASAIPSSATLEPDVEYFVGSLAISHAKTVGTGACGGCDVPVCVIFSQLHVSTPNIANDLWMWNGANWEGSQIVSWQNSYVAGTVISTFNPGGGPQHKSITSCVPYSTSPARTSTWGAVKALYR